MVSQPTDFDLAAHDEIKRRLKRAGVKFTDIAREVGCQASLVTLVSQGQRRNRIVERVIAGRLGVEPDELWPLRYRLELQAKEVAS